MKKRLLKTSFGTFDLNNVKANSFVKQYKIGDKIMKRLIVDWHTKDGYYCGNLAIDYEKRRPTDKKIKEQIVKDKPHLKGISNIEIEILK